MTESPRENRVAELGDAAHAELDQVLGTALAVAREQLEAHGVFLPFGIGLQVSGTESKQPELRLLAIQPPENEDDPEADVDTEVMMEDLVELLRQQRDLFSALAFVSDVTLVEDGRDAVHAVAEHSLGGSVAVVQPYTAPAAEDGDWVFDEPEVEPAELQIWAS